MSTSLKYCVLFMNIIHIITGSKNMSWLSDDITKHIVFDYIDRNEHFKFREINKQFYNLFNVTYPVTVNHLNDWIKLKDFLSSLTFEIPKKSSYHLKT